MWKYFKFWDIVTRPEQGKISLEQFILDVLISLLQIQITQQPQSCFSVVIFIMSQINCLIFWNLSYVRKCQADQLKSRSSFIDTKNRHYFVSRLLQSSKKWLKPDLSLEWENIYDNYNLYFSEFTQDLTEREYEAESIIREDYPNNDKIPYGHSLSSSVTLSRVSRTTRSLRNLAMKKNIESRSRLSQKSTSMMGLRN